VPAGAALAAERGPELVIFDGSGAAIPPVETDARVLVTSTRQAREVVTGYLNAYRILVSDLVIVTGALDEELVEAIREVKELAVVSVELRPRPIAPVLGRRVAYFTTAPADAHAAIERYLCEELGAEVVLVSGNLARRDALREDLARAGEAEVYLVEIKAAAIDVVAEAALERGVEVVFADNELVPVGVLDLDSELIRLADQAIARQAVAQ
jgi:cyclic 2,3-diphosphoglycerate synthetase